MPEAQRRVGLSTYALLIVIVLICVYSTTYGRDFAVLDDYVSLADTYPHSALVPDALQTPIEAMGVMGYALLQGRILNAVFIGGLFKIFNSVQKVEAIRLIGVLGTACYAALLMCLLRRWQVSPFLSFLIACLAGLLPPFVEVAVFAGISSYPWSCAVALTVAIYIDAIFLAGSDGKRLVFQAPRLRQSTAIVVGIVAALFCYPSAAQLLFCLPLRYLLPRQGGSAWKAARCGIFVLAHFIVGGIAFVVLWKTYAKLFLPALSLGQRNWISSPAEVWAKLSYFVDVTLLSAFNLFKLSPTWPIAFVVLFACALGLVSRDFRSSAGSLAVWLLLIPCTYAANLVVSENWSTYRTQLALQTFVIVSLALSLIRVAGLILRNSRYVDRRDTLVGSGMFVALAIIATRQFFVVGPEISIPHAEEWQMLRSAITKAEEDPGLTGVVFVRPDWSANAPTLIRFDSIGTPSGFASWVTESMVKVASWDVARRPLRVPLYIITPEQAVDFSLPPGAALIDMNAMLRRRASTRPRPFR